MIFALLLGCGPKIEPLQPMQEQIRRARKAGPDGNPHVRFKLAEETLQNIVIGMINPDKPIVLPVMIGTVATIAIDLDPPSISTRTSSKCNCTVATVDGDGKLDVTVSGLLGRQVLAKDLGVSATVRGAPQFTVEPQADGARHLIMTGSKREPWSVDLNLAEEKGFLTNKLVDGQFQKPVSDLLDKPIILAKLPETLPVNPVRLRLEPAKDPEVAIWMGSEPSDAAPAFDIEGGWGASLSDSGVLSLARAALGKFEQHKTWKIEPLGVRLRGETFEADVRVHRKARKVQYRDYTVTGVVEALDDRYHIDPKAVVETGKEGWGGSLIGAFVPGQVRRQVLKRQFDIPRAFETQDPKFPTRWTVRSLEGSDAGVFVRGDLELLTPEPAAKAPKGKKAPQGKGPGDKKAPAGKGPK